MKKLILILLLLIPINTNALTGNVNINCTSNSLNENSTTTCTLSGYSKEEVSAISMDLTASGNITITNVSTSNIWQGDGIGGDIDLYTADNKKDNFAIATFQIKVQTAGTGTINATNIIFSDSNFNENPISNQSLTISIKKEEVKQETNNQTSQNNNQTPQNNTQSNNTKNQSESTTNTEKKSNDANLKNLSISNVEFIFSKDTTNYDIEVANDITNISITAEPNDSKATVDIPTDLNLNLGKNSFSIKVTAEDGTTQSYNLNITRLDKELSNNSTLKTLIIDDNEIPLKDNNYAYNLGNIKTSSLKVQATPEDTKAKVLIYGNNKIGKNDIILIKVIAEDNTSSEYIIHANNTNNLNLSFIITLVLFIISLIFNVLLIIYIKKNKKTT